MRRRLVYLLLASLETACGDPSARDRPTVGLELEPVVYRPMGTGTLDDGGPIDLFAAPQGGHVLVVGARVGGLDSATVELAARLLWTETQALVVESTRTTKLVPIDGRPGWREPDASDLYAYVHLPVCPDPQGRAIVGSSLTLELRVTELYSDFASAQLSIEVFPMCTTAAAPNVSHCECECGGGPVSAACQLPN